MSDFKTVQLANYRATLGETLRVDALCGNGWHGVPFVGTIRRIRRVSGQMAVDIMYRATGSIGTFYAKTVFVHGRP
jgi:hypothetical protein